MVETNGQTSICTQQILKPYNAYVGNFRGRPWTEKNRGDVYFSRPIRSFKERGSFHYLKAKRRQKKMATSIK